MDVTHFAGGEERWCLRFEYAVARQGEADRELGTSVKTSYTDFDTMKALYDQVIEWLQSPAAPAVFHEKQVLEECFKEGEGGGSIEKQTIRRKCPTLRPSLPCICGGYRSSRPT